MATIAAATAYRPDEQIFAGHHRGFLAMFGLATLQIACGIVVGQKTPDFYILPRSFGELWIWVLPPLLWLIFRTHEAGKARISVVPHLHASAQSDRNWFLRGLLILLFLVPANRSFTAIKVAIPTLNPYYADDTLSKIDNFIFLGSDPWIITHAFIGPVGTMILDFLYVIWFPIMGLLLAWTTFSRDPAFQLRASFVHLSIWVLLGSAMAVAMSSVGPCYLHPLMDDGRFLPLMDILNDQSLVALQNQNYLLSNYGKEIIGSGISAMPSLHVALSVFLYLLCREAFGRSNWVSRLALVYAILMWVGSVHLAWHYAVDGIVSAICVVALWLISKRLVSVPPVSVRQDRSGLSEIGSV